MTNLYLLFINGCSGAVELEPYLVGFKSMEVTIRGRTLLVYST